MVRKAERARWEEMENGRESGRGGGRKKNGGFWMAENGERMDGNGIKK